MIGRPGWVVALVSLVIVVAGALGLRARAVLAREADWASRLNVLASAERSLGPAVLAIRGGAARDYDGLAPIVRKLRDVRTLAKEATDLEPVARQLLEQESQIELLKTNVALFRVSTLALPSVLEQVPAGDAASASVAALRADTLRYIVLPDRGKADRLRAAALSLDPSQTPGGQGAGDPRTILVGHVRSLVEHGERADQLISSLVRPDLAAALAEAAWLHEHRATRAEIVAVAAGTAILFLLLLLAGLGIETVLSRRAR